MIYLKIPNFPDVHGAPGAVLEAYGKIASLQADFSAGRGQVMLLIYQSLAAAQADAEPIDRVTIRTGGRALKPGQRTGPTFPDLAAVQAANADAWAAIWTYLLTHISEQSVFDGSSIVTP